jgi:DNA-binding SARP family transcriptional activator
MRLMLLGPLRLLDDDGERVEVTGPRQRNLLAALAVYANQPVSADNLAEMVWDGAPPPGSIVTLRSHLARLRRLLGARIARRIVTRPPGYAIELGDDELDLLEFANHCRRAGAALRAADYAEASEFGARALALWRGRPLSDVPSELLRDLLVPQFERQRIQVAEDWIEAELRLGRYEPVLERLRDLTAQYPLREHFHVQLMLALAHTGRRAEALTAYQDARKTLVSELGVEPGQEMRALHERILADEPELPAATEIPRQLPAAAGHFTGRNAELEWLTDLAEPGDPQAGAPDPVVISAIDGMAGIGKSALAVHAAHALSSRFPDGQLFVDLHAYTKGHPPRDPGDALGMLLRALQVPAQRIPEDTQERAALYRQRLTGTRTLILLDNAADEAQVRPLLPAAPGCLVLVTSRRRLKGLDDARSVSLGLLPLRDAVALLRAVAGPDRIAADDPLLDEIAQRCGRLPLAVRIAAALLRHRPAWSPEHLIALLRDENRRLSALSDGERDLATVFDLSYAGLTGQHRLLLRRLALVPGPDADAYAAAALLDTDPDTATGLLENLVDHNLLIAYAPGRYRMHDLIRAHARTLADADPAPDRAAALDRLLHYYAHTAHDASVPITRRPRRASARPAPAYAPVLAGPEDARAWLRAERDNLEHAYAHAAANALHTHALGLAAGLAETLRTDGPYTRALALHQAATDTAQLQGNPTAHADALIDLGIMQRLTGDRPGEADMLAETGVIRRVRGDLAGAGADLSRALEIYRATGDRHGEADALTEAGRVRALIGDLPGAGDALGRALEFYRTTGHHHGEAYALTNIATVRRLTADLPGAGDLLGRALEIYRAIGYGQGEAEALANLGIVRRLTGDLAGAGDAQAVALEIYQKIGSRHDEAWALNQYAATIAAGRDLPRALELYQRALAMNRDLDKADGQALALEGLGECHLTAGEVEPGAAYLRRALGIYERLGMTPDAEQVRTRLAGLTAV